MGAAHTTTSLKQFKNKGTLSQKRKTMTCAKNNCGRLARTTRNTRVRGTHAAAEGGRQRPTGACGRNARAATTSTAATTAAAAAAAATATTATVSAAAAVTTTKQNALYRMLSELGTSGGVLLACLLLSSCFFALAETSISTMWPWKVRWLARTEGPGSPFRLLERDIQRFVTTCLLGSTITNIGATALVTETATSVLGNSANALTIVTFVMTVVMLLVTEVMPKSVAVESAQAVMSKIVYPLSLIAKVLYPVGWLFTSMSRGIFALFGYKTSSNLTAAVSEEELKLMLQGAENSGAIEGEENDMIRRVMTLDDMSVDAVMTPLFNLVAVESNATLKQWYEQWEVSRYSRMPVYTERIDNIVGLCYSTDILELLAKKSLDVDVGGDEAGAGEIYGRTVSTVVRTESTFFVPESMSLWKLLTEFRIRKVHMAVVVNEYGGAAGIVTLEDVVEEIVGEIFDETDYLNEVGDALVEVANGVWSVNADVELETLGKLTGLQFDDEKYRNVGGYVCDIFDDIPQPGESTTAVVDVAESVLEEMNAEEDLERTDDGASSSKRKLTIMVTSGTKRKVKSVKIVIDRADEEGEGDEDESKQVGDMDADVQSSDVHGSNTAAGVEVSLQGVETGAVMAPERREAAVSASKNGSSVPSSSFVASFNGKQNGGGADTLHT